MYLKFLNIIAQNLGNSQYFFPSYIENLSTSAWIDTGLYPSGIGKIVTTKKFLAQPTTNVGDGMTGSNFYYLSAGFLSPGSFGAQAGGGGSERTVAAFDTDWHTFILDTINFTASVDSTTISLPTTSFLSSDRTVFLFVRNDGAYNRLCSCRISGCDIYDRTNILIRKLVPAVRREDLRAGMYDQVNDNFYPSLGTGTITYG